MLARRRKSGPKVEHWLGATLPTGSLPIVLFVPSQDRDGRDIDHDYWVTSALETLGILFRARPRTHAPVVFGVMTSDKASFGMKSRLSSPANET